MQAKDVVKLALRSTQELIPMYLGDLSDADVTMRVVPSANNIAWQMAHLIVAEKMLLEEVLPGAKYPELPAGIASLGSERTGKVDPPEGYPTKAMLLEWFTKLRAVTISCVDKLSDSDLDAVNTGMMAKFAPTVVELLIMMANHTLMHGGQFTVTRRALNKPVAF